MGLPAGQQALLVATLAAARPVTDAAAVAARSRSTSRCSPAAAWAGLHRADLRVGVSRMPPIRLLMPQSKTKLLSRGAMNILGTFLWPLEARGERV